ncbi:hypothetical protein [Polyangium sp. 6x1]|uniref:hypothetical protein n=1 Tax=Polyangium sp. 6x1 TaxID=3042689 RepID=UPI00248293BE|nr:hypothetical protein [Polyangium sp. 6x1]MDI1444628.1 hypothetical protein [Polyangium sp. 6x1]
MWSIAGRGTDRGNRVKLLDVCEPVLLTGNVIGADRVFPATGRHLHLVYCIDGGKVRPGIAGLGGDATDPAFEVEFDITGPNHLNWPGTVYLTDGDPTITYQVETSVLRCAPQFAWHPLTTRQLNLEIPVRIPKHHSRMSAARGAAYTLAGTTGTLDHVPIPCAGDDLIVFSGAGTTFFTEWWG